MKLLSWCHESRVGAVESPLGIKAFFFLFYMGCKSIIFLVTKVRLGSGDREIRACEAWCTLFPEVQSV